jgi:hypothetical protein
LKFTGENGEARSAEEVVPVLRAKKIEKLGLFLSQHLTNHIALPIVMRSARSFLYREIFSWKTNITLRLEPISPR